MVGGTSHSQFENANEDGTPSLSESADGTQRDPLPYDRVQLGAGGDAGFGVEVPPLSNSTEFHRCDAGVGRVRVVHPPTQRSSKRTMEQHAGNDFRANRWAPTWATRTTGTQTPTEAIQTHANATQSKPKPLRHSSLGLRPCHSLPIL